MKYTDDIMKHNAKQKHVHILWDILEIFTLIMML